MGDLTWHLFLIWQLFLIWHLSSSYGRYVEKAVMSTTNDKHVALIA